MNKRTLKRAIGVSHDKTLTISNDCGSAYITQEISYTERKGRGAARRQIVSYVVGTDGCLDRTFKTLEKAFAFALNDLATSMDGSPNR